MMIADYTTAVWLTALAAVTILIASNPPAPAADSWEPRPTIDRAEQVWPWLETARRDLPRPESPVPMPAPEPDPSLEPKPEPAPAPAPAPPPKPAPEPHSHPAPGGSCEAAVAAAAAPWPVVCAPGGMAGSGQGGHIRFTSYENCRVVRIVLYTDYRLGMSYSARLAHELAHARDCVDDGEVNGSTGLHAR